MATRAQHGKAEPGMDPAPLRVAHVAPMATPAADGDAAGAPEIHFAPPSSRMYDRRDDLTMCGRPTASLAREHYTTDSERCHALFGQPRGAVVCERCLAEWRRVGFCYYEPDLDGLPID